MLVIFLRNQLLSFNPLVIFKKEPAFYGMEFLGTKPTRACHFLEDPAHKDVICHFFKEPIYKDLIHFEEPAHKGVVIYVETSGLQ